MKRLKQWLLGRLISTSDPIEVMRLVAESSMGHAGLANLAAVGERGVAYIRERAASGDTRAMGIKMAIAGAPRTVTRP